jgi:hypothetical protein
MLMKELLGALIVFAVTFAVPTVVCTAFRRRRARQEAPRN